MPHAPGEHWLDLVAENAFGQGAARVRLEILPPAPAANAAPFPAPPRSIHGVVGQGLPYSPWLSNDGRTTFSAAGLPAGINLHSGTGEINGVPAAAGVFEATLTATNPEGTFASPVTFVIDASAASPLLSGTAAVELVLGESLSLALNPSDSAATLSASGLPAGVDLDTASRRLVGTPSTAGRHQVEITAANAAGTTTSLVTILVHPSAVRPPELTNNGLWITELGVSSTLRLGATQGPATFAVEGLPAWASFDSATATLRARPTSLGIFPLRVTATNSRGSGRGVVNLYVGTVTAQNNAFYFPSHSSPLPLPLTIAGTIGASFSYNLPGGPDSYYYYSPSDSPSSLTVEGLPAGLTFHEQDRRITGTMSAAGDYPVTVRYIENGDMVEAITTLAFRHDAPVAPPTAPVHPASLIIAPLTLSVRTESSANLAVFTPASGASFTVSGLPSGLSFAPSTGRIIGIPTTTGSFPLDLTVAHSAGVAQARTLLQVSAARRPVFSSPSITRSATSGVAFSEWFYATNSPTSYGCLGSMPFGLTFDTTNGMLEGTPTVPGTYFLTILAANAAGQDRLPFTLVVRPPEPAEISFPAQLVLTQGVSVNRMASSYPFGATFFATGLPPGLVMSSAGALSGTPTTSGEFVVLINASRDGASSALRSSFRVLPTPPPQLPVFTSAAGTSAVLGTPFSFRLLATNAPSVYTADPLPAGLSLDSASGLIAGTPTQAGDYVINCGASNVLGSANARLMLRVLATPAGPPTLSPPAPAQLILGDETARLDLQPGNAPTSLAADGLPRGLMLNTAGVIQGVPREPGVFPVTITAVNAVGSTITTFDLKIRTSPTAPIPTLNSVLHARVGRPLSQAIGYHVPTYEPPTEIEIVGLPPELSFDPATGLITGTPLDAGTTDFDVLVRTARAGGHARVRLIVSPWVLERPFFTSPSTVHATYGQPFTHKLTAEWASYFSATDLPHWLALDIGSGVLTGTPDNTGDFAVQISATNSRGTRVARLNIAVRFPGESPPLLLNTPGSLVCRIGEQFAHELSFANSGYLDFVSGFPGYVSYGPRKVMEYSPSYPDWIGVGILTISSFGPGGYHASSVAFETENADPSVLSLQAPAAIRIGVSGYVSQQFTTSIPSAIFSASSLPPGLILTPSGGLHGSPSEAGEYRAAITASSGANSVTGFVHISVISLGFSPFPTPSDPAPGYELLLGDYISFEPRLPDLGFSYYDFTYRADGLPPGLFLDPGRRRIRGVPSTSGTYTVTISAVPRSSYYYGYPVLPAPQTIQITVRATALAPTAFTSPAEYRGTLGIDFSQTLSATSARSRFTAAGLPPGLALDEITGEISGRPSAAGEYLVAATASNSAGSVPATLRFVISAETPTPVIDGQLHAVLKAGDYAGLPLGVLNSPASVSVTGLPPGMTHSSADSITGTPTTPGDYTVTISATNDGGTSVASILVQVLPPDLADMFWPAIDLTFDAGTNLSELILAPSSSAHAPELSATGLPPGLFLDRPYASSIYLEGRLDTPGTYPVTFALSAYGQGLIVPALVNVLAPSAPSLSSAAVHVITAGQTFEYTPGVSSSSTRLDLPSLPDGVFFNASTRRLSGVIATPGAYEIPITATAPSGQTVTARLALVVRAATPVSTEPAHPLLTSSAHLLAHVGAPVVHPLASANADATFTVGPLPPGLRYDAKQRAILGQPTTAGRHLVAITARAGELTESATLLITIRPYETRLTNFVPGLRLPPGGLAYVGVPFDDSAATAPTSPGAWAYSGLAPGLHSPASGGIVGVPTLTGEFELGASLGVTPPLVFTRAITVEAAPRSIAIPIHAAQAELIPGAPVAIAVSTSQPASLEFSGLPPGIVYSAAQRRLVGQCSAPAGAYPLQVTATNIHGAFTSRLCLVVRSGLGLPRFTSPSAAPATRHETFVYPAATTPAAASFTVENLPAGLTLDPATGRISGRPEVVGEHALQLTAANSAGSSTLALRLRVEPGLTAEPALTVRANSLWPLGTDRSLHLARPQTTAVSASSLPAGVAFDATDRLLFGRLLDPGTTNVHLASSLGAARPSLVTRDPLLSPPWFIHEPEDLIALAGRPVRFRALADGRSTPSLAWTLGGSARSAQPDGTLLIASADLALDGTEIVARATNPSGQATSRVATLTLRSVPVLSFTEWAASRGLPPGERDPLHTPPPGTTPNLLAYAMDLAPGESFVPKPEFIALPTPMLRLTYSRAKYAGTVTLVPQRSADLATWHEDGVIAEKLSEDTYREMWRATIPATGPRHFLRLTATALRE
jgi:PKD repeat protein